MAQELKVINNNAISEENRQTVEMNASFIMTNTEKVRDIFSILHDGTIISWTGGKHLLTLEIGRQYLAERIDKTFDNFFVDLIGINRLVLVPWMSPLELELVGNIGTSLQIDDTKHIIQIPDSHSLLPI